MKTTFLKMLFLLLTASLALPAIAEDYIYLKCTFQDEKNQKSEEVYRIKGGQVFQQLKQDMTYSGWGASRACNTEDSDSGEFRRRTHCTATPMSFEIDYLDFEYFRDETRNHTLMIAYRDEGKLSINRQTGEASWYRFLGGVKAEKKETIEKKGLCEPIPEPKPKTKF